jgi:hypothetical protein
MKTFTLTCAALLLVLSAQAFAQSSAGLAIPLGANLQVGLTISEVIVDVLQGYAEAPFAVFIEITSVNGEPHDHGSAVKELSDAVVLDQVQGIATVSIAWAEDEIPAVAADTYTICATLVWPNPDIVGETKCIDQDIEE